MIKLSGYYFSGLDSKKRGVNVEIWGDTFTLRFDDQTHKTYHSLDYKIEPPLGSTVRVFRFNDGSTFETYDFEGVAKIVQSGLIYNRLDQLEKNKVLVFSSIVVVMCFFLLAHFVFIPLSAKWIASIVPQKTISLLEASSLHTIKKFWSVKLETLDSKKYPEVEQKFKSIIEQYPGLNLRINIIDSKLLGANAFALPAGQILVTKDILDVVTPDELYAILFHEVGHVHHRHSVGAIVKGAGVFIALSLIVGASDFGSITLALVNSAYSRSDELEADAFGGEALGKEKLNPLLLISGLRKIEKHAEDRYKRLSKEEKSESKANKVLQFFSTHPLTDERDEKLKLKAIKYGFE